LFSLDQRS